MPHLEVLWAEVSVGPPDGGDSGHIGGLGCGGREARDLYEEGEGRLKSKPSFTYIFRCWVI